MHWEMRVILAIYLFFPGIIMALFKYGV